MSVLLQEKGIIFSPDFINIEATLKILDKCHPFFSGIKIGNPTLYQYGFEVLRKIKKHFDLPIICDFKLMDIPIIADHIIGLGIHYGMDGAMIWGLAGEEILCSCISRAKDDHIMIFILTEFTHVNNIPESTSNEIASLAVKLGAFGIQAPATRPNRVQGLRKIIGKELKIISCGVGCQGAPYGSAIKNGADYEIIGRSICLAPEPMKEAEKAYNAINSHVLLDA
jgi:orotidine-5'-phosphate decarboxylase